MSLLSSSSPSLPEVQQVAEDCPICLDEMSPADVLHPVQCRCGYNFCAGCIESLITSSKDDYQEASDGNLHVKVFLHCPNCRSDLGGSIRDTLLCRKVCNLEEHTTTDELTQSEMRLQQVLDDPEVKLAIREAQQRQDDFFGIKSARHPPEKQSSFHLRDSFTRMFKEMGVEADLEHGAHQSFIIRKNAPPPKNRRKLDPTLFPGLDVAMSQEEKLQVTDLLTAGCPNQLAEAAQILNQIAVRLHCGLPPPVETQPLAKPQLDRRSSVYELIDESREVHEHKPKTRRLKSFNDSQESMRHFPLPVRMPKYAQFDKCDSHPETGGCSFLPCFLETNILDRPLLPLKFCDDTWDGTVVDAFSKIYVDRKGKVTKKAVENSDVLSILNASEENRSVISQPQTRVLVASIRRDAGRQGVLKGDVVTHLNGKPWVGTANELETAIREAKDGFSIIFNAEASVAEALKRRSMI